MNQATNKPEKNEIQEILMSLKDILVFLLDSASLDQREHAKDCMDCFSDYQWLMLPNANAERFQALQKKGDEGELSFNELNEFMLMASPSGIVGEYFQIVHARKLLQRLDILNTANQN